MKKLLIGIILSGLITVPAMAKYVTPLNGPGVTITKYFVHSNGALSLYISGPTQNLDECTSAYRVYVPHDVVGKDMMVSAALMAFASGRKIGLHGSGCNTTAFWGGTVDVPIINNLWVF